MPKLKFKLVQPKQTLIYYVLQDILIYIFILLFKFIIFSSELYFFKVNK